MRIARHCLIIASLSSAILSAMAGPLPPSGIFVYSTLCDDGEDYHGERLTIIRRPEGNIAIYEYTEGALMAPLFGTGPEVKIDTTGKVSLSFTGDGDRSPRETVVFEGTISEDALAVTRNGRRTYRLPRELVPKKMPSCTDHVTSAP